MRTSRAERETFSCIISSELNTTYVACGIFSEASVVHSDNIGERKAESTSSITVAALFSSKLEPAATSASRIDRSEGLGSTPSEFSIACRCWWTSGVNNSNGLCGWKAGLKNKNVRVSHYLQMLPVWLGCPLTTVRAYQITHLKLTMAKDGGMYILPECIAVWNWTDWRLWRTGRRYEAIFLLVQRFLFIS